MDTKEKYHEEDDTKESVDHLIEHRVPWLFVGLLGGLLTAFIISQFEEILSSDVRLVFFIPLIVYLSDAVGTQTETIYVRALAYKKNIHFLKYIIKESLVGLGLGTIFGIILGTAATYWLSSSEIGLAVGMAVFVNLLIAPLLTLFISHVIHKHRADPALGAGPVATIIQDLVSLLIYFAVAGIIIF